MKRKSRRNNKLKGGSSIKFAVMAIFKNEAMVLEEWIQHYLWQGVDMIVLLDNNSTDKYKLITDKYKDKVHVFDAPKKHAQNEYYNTIGIPFLREHKVDAVGIFDVDEYMFGTDGKNLKEHVVSIFSKSNHPSQFSCHWSMFGSSGLEKQPESIRKSFIWKGKELDKDVKSVVWLNSVSSDSFNQSTDSLTQHQSKVSGETIGCPKGLQLNHYVTMSKEYFEKIKMSRGDVVNPSCDNIRNWDYFFNRVKQPLVEDMTLAKLL